MQSIQLGLFQGKPTLDSDHSPQGTAKRAFEAKFEPLAASTTSLAAKNSSNIGRLCFLTFVVAKIQKPALPILCHPVKISCTLATSLSYGSLMTYGQHLVNHCQRYAVRESSKSSISVRHRLRVSKSVSSCFRICHAVLCTRHADLVV